MKVKTLRTLLWVVLIGVSCVSLTQAQPLEFPAMATTAKPGEYVLSANQPAEKITPTQTVIFYTFEMITPGDVESTIKSPFDEFTRPNALIIPIPPGQTAEVGDIVLTWWQSGSGMNRAYVVNVDNPTQPVVKYIDIDYDNPATGKDGVPIGQMDEQLKPDSFVKLTEKFAPGTAVAVKDEEWGSYEHYQVINVVGDQVVVIGFAGKMNIFGKAKCIPVPIMPKAKVGVEVFGVTMSSFKKVTVKKVDTVMGRVFTDKDEAIAFGDVINPVQMTQDFLTRLGYDPGPVDGAMGKKTEAAIREFQKDHGITEDGTPSLELVEKLYAEIYRTQMPAAAPQPDVVASKPEEQPAPSAPTPTPKPAEPTPTPKPTPPPVAVEPKDPATMKCSFGSCTAENGFTEEMVTQFKTKDGNWDNKKLTLKKVANADLQHLPALKDVLETLEFWDKNPEITDLSPLVKLDGLKQLRLSEMDNLTDISPLAGLKSLESINLYVLRGLTDLTPLGKIQSLKAVELTVLGEPIDLAPLGNLTNLQALDINQSVKYTNLEFLQPLNNLEKLDILAGQKDVSDISALAGKTKLKELSLHQLGVTDISVLKDSKDLEILKLGSTKVQDLSILKELKKLKSLDLGYVSTPNLDLGPVGELSELTFIDLTNVTAPDYTPLAKCTKLEKIEAQKKSNFDNLAAIKALPNLKSLNVWSNKSLQNWEALAEMTSLEELLVGDTSFSDLSLLAKMNNLRTIGVSKCTVTNPEAITTLPKLKYLYVDGAQGIEDISMFKNLAEIANLYVRHDKEQFPQDQLDALNQRKEAEKKLKKVFEEKFNNNRKEWHEVDNEEATVKIEDGKYLFDHKRETGAWMSWKSPGIDPQNDFSIEVTMTKIDGVDNHGYGVIWGIKDVNSYYEFVVSGNGHYRVGKMADDTWSDIVEWTASDFVNQGNTSNTLSVKKIGTQVKFYINQRYVGESAFEDVFGEHVGFKVTRKMSVEVDELVVKN